MEVPHLPCFNLRKLSSYGQVDESLAGNGKAVDSKMLRVVLCSGQRTKHGHDVRTVALEQFNDFVLRESVGKAHKLSCTAMHCTCDSRPDTLSSKGSVFGLTSTVSVAQSWCNAVYPVSFNRLRLRSTYSGSSSLFFPKRCMLRDRHEPLVYTFSSASLSRLS